MRRGLSGLSFLALSAALAAPAVAQQGDAPPAGATQATRTTAYDAAFFAQYAPRTALDIARPVPGFALDLGDIDTRGFAGAAGNVVINGARPSSKAETLETTLARISLPAAWPASKSGRATSMAPNIRPRARC